VRKLKPKKVVLVHGDPPAVAWFEESIKTALPACEVIRPTPGVTIEI
jgi:predicted metal-dependent RNase